MTTATDPKAALERLLATMAALRGEEGCPWDREQTHRSLVPYLIEEAHEVAEAIETGPPEALRGELGDLLLQVVFHCRIAEEAGHFAFGEVAEALADKLRRRHPHVFGAGRADTAEEVSRQWHERKRRERDSALDGIPAALPALQRAAKVSHAAARTGFEWRHQGEILDKAREELEEFAEAVRHRPEHPAGHEAMADELGDLFFALVQLARWQGIDPEQALRRATRKFAGRFRWMERAVRDEQGGEARLPEQWEALWARAKAEAPS